MERISHEQLSTYVFDSLILGDRLRAERTCRAWTNTMPYYGIRHLRLPDDYKEPDGMGKEHEFDTDVQWDSQSNLDRIQLSVGIEVISNYLIFGQCVAASRMPGRSVVRALNMYALAVLKCRGVVALTVTERFPVNDECLNLISPSCLTSMDLTLAYQCDWKVRMDL